MVTSVKPDMQAFSVMVVLIDLTCYKLFFFPQFEQFLAVCVFKSPYTSIKEFDTVMRNVYPSMHAATYF